MQSTSVTGIVNENTECATPRRSRRMLSHRRAPLARAFRMRLAQHGQLALVGFAFDEPAHFGNLAFLQFRGRAVEDDFSLEQHHHVIADFQRLSHVMRHHHARHLQLALQNEDEFIDDIGPDRVQPGGRLVVEDYLGSMAMARARATRLRCPPDSSAGIFFRVSGRPTISVSGRPARSICSWVCWFPRPRESDIGLDRHGIEQCPALEQKAKSAAVGTSAAG